MDRNYNTDRNGSKWSDDTIKAVWNKGAIVHGNDPNIWRKDKCGKFMNYSQHGNRKSDYGWEIDHINPVSNGGGDELSNLQPLHWENNANKGDILNWNCNK